MIIEVYRKFNGTFQMVYCLSNPNIEQKLGKKWRKDSFLVLVLSLVSFTDAYSTKEKQNGGYNQIQLQSTLQIHDIYPINLFGLLFLKSLIGKWCTDQAAR